MFNFVSRLNHNTDNPLWIFLLVQFHFTTSLNKLFAGALVLGSVLSLNPVAANATDTDQGFEENGVYYSSQAAKDASDAYDAKYPLTNECSEDYKKKDDRWFNKDGNWYYAYNKFDFNQRHVDSWEHINGFWYHFNEDGAMDKNVTLKDPKGNDCTLNSDGALTNRESPELGNGYGPKVYAREHNIKKGWVIEQGKWHFYNENGEMQKNKTIIDGNNKYVLDANGEYII